MQNLDSRLFIIESSNSSNLEMEFLLILSCYTLTALAYKIDAILLA